MATSIAGPTQRGPRPGSLGRLDVERRLGAGTAHPGFLERHGYVLSRVGRHELDEAHGRGRRRAARSRRPEGLRGPEALFPQEPRLGNRRCPTGSTSDSERGHSSANDPVTISPAGSYVPITTPVVETLLPTSFSPEGMVPSENRRLPDPMTRGQTHRRDWATRLWRQRGWGRCPLTWPRQLCPP